MLNEEMVGELRACAQFFETSTSCLSEEDSGFAPKEGMYTVAQQVVHVAQTIEWFVDGAFSPTGFDMDFDKYMKELGEVTSLAVARQWLRKAIDHAIDVFQKSSEDDLRHPIVEGPIMGGRPRHTVVAAISDHTAHHRGALTVYSRLLGKEPQMPYSD